MLKSLKFRTSLIIIILFYCQYHLNTCTLLKQVATIEPKEDDTQKVNCEKPCLNGGICSNGLCYCTDNYSGEFCETKYQYNFIDQKLAIAICIICVFLGSFCVWCGISAYQKVAKGRGSSDQPIIRTREVYFEA